MAECILRGVWSGCVVLAATAAAVAGEVDYETYPYYGGASESVGLFRTVMKRAAGTPDRAVRFLYDGDSQETSPGGQGNLYVPLVLHRFWLHFGNIPESQMMAPGFYSGALLQSAQAIGALAMGSMPLERVPFRMAPGGDGLLKNRYTAQTWLGAATLFQANLMNVPSELTEIDRTIEYSEREGLSFHMLLPHLPNQATSFKVRFAQSPVSGVSFGATTQSTAIVTMPELAEDANAWSELALPYDFGGFPPTPLNLLTAYPQVIVSGDPAVRRGGPGAEVEPGPSWFSSGNTRGIAVSTISEGGQTVADQFNKHPDCLPFIAAYDPDVVLLACMVNDAALGYGISAEEFQLHLKAKIDSYLLAKPDLVFVLLGDPDTANGAMPEPNFVEFDAMGSKVRELALDPANRAIFIDRKLLLDAHRGWHRENAASSAFLIDQFHYNLVGARAVAEEDVSAMLTMAFGSDCRADLNGNAVIEAGDLAILLGAWGSGGDADLDGDGIVGGVDIAMLLGAWGPCTGE